MIQMFTVRFTRAMIRTAWKYTFRRDEYDEFQRKLIQYYRNCYHGGFTSGQRR